MEKCVIAELKSTYNKGFLTSCIEIDEIVNEFKKRQDEFDNGGIFVEIYDKETITDSCVSVSKIAACIRKYTIEGDVTKDLDVYLKLEVDILDTPMGRKLVNNDSDDSAHSIEAYLLFNRIYKKFLIVDADEYTFIPTKEVSSLLFFVVGLLTEQKEVSDKISEEDADCSDVNVNEDVNDVECQDSCADSKCCDCAEQTYSSREYHKLESELIEKDHEIWKLKRTVEALEYLIYNCIPEGDRRKWCD